MVKGYEGGKRRNDWDYDASQYSNSKRRNDEMVELSSEGDTIGDIRGSDEDFRTDEWSLVYTEDNVVSSHIRKVLVIDSQDSLLLDSIRRYILDVNSEKLQMADDYV